MICNTLRIIFYTTFGQITPSTMKTLINNTNIKIKQKILDQLIVMMMMMMMIFAINIQY